VQVWAFEKVDQLDGCLKNKMAGQKVFREIFEEVIACKFRCVFSEASTWISTGRLKGKRNVYVDLQIKNVSIKVGDRGGAFFVCLLENEWLFNDSLNSFLKL